MKRKLASLLLAVSFALVLVIPVHAGTSHSVIAFADFHGG